MCRDWQPRSPNCPNPSFPATGFYTHTRARLDSKLTPHARAMTLDVATQLFAPRLQIVANTSPVFDKGTEGTSTKQTASKLDTLASKLDTAM